MKRTYYNLNLNTELEQCYLAVEEADQVQVLKLHGSGVLEGLETSQNCPTADMSVLVGAGYAWDGNGALLNPTETATVDCSVDEESVSTIPSSGKERYIVIAVEADRKVTPGTVSNTDEDSYAYVVVSGDEADPGEAVAPELTDGRIHLAKVLLDEFTTAITDAMIDTSDRPEIITVAKHMADHEAHAAEDLTYDNSTSGMTATNVQDAIDEMEDRVESVESGLGGGDRINQKIYDTAGTFTFTQGTDCPVDVTQVRVRVWGAGGGGGGADSGQSYASAGAAGGLAIQNVSLTTDEVVSVTVGAGGAGGTDGSENGTAGGTSLFGSYCSATGGNPGSGSDTYPAPGATGGSGVDGDINLTGQSSCAVTNGFMTGNPCGGNAPQGGPGGVLGENGQMPGGGGGGSTGYYGSFLVGGNGGDGMVIVSWIEAA